MQNPVKKALKRMFFALKTKKLPLQNSTKMLIIAYVAVFSSMLSTLKTTLVNAEKTTTKAQIVIIAKTEDTTDCVKATNKSGIFSFLGFVSKDSKSFFKINFPSIIALDI